jgi:hypothetical protein
LQRAKSAEIARTDVERFDMEERERLVKAAELA